jgi:hypothetical protein
MKTFRRLAQTRHTLGVRQRGGFLLEVALVLVAVGALTVATFEAQSALQQRQQQAGATNILMATDAAIRKFVVRNRRLPCPASGNSGVEAGGEAGCGSIVGSVPFVTLGLEVPALPGGLVIRYGLAESLVTPGVDPLQDSLLHRAAKLIAPSLDSGGTTGAPYLAGTDAARLFANCDSAALNPAYVLMWRPQAGAGVPSVPMLCFRESADGSMGVLAVGGPEFFGWLHSALKAY